MTDQTLPDYTETLATDMRKAHTPVYRITALLAGIEALLEKTEAPDTDGLIWSAQQLVEHTQTAVDELMAGLDRVATRVEQIERAAVV